MKQQSATDHEEERGRETRGETKRSQKEKVEKFGQRGEKINKQKR